MGGGSSAHVKVSRNIDNVSRLVMPVYYTDEPLTDEEIEIARKTWKMIVNDNSPYFDQRKRKISDFAHANCLELFYESLYNRLFNVHPVARGLFHKSVNKQGSFLARFISKVLVELTDEVKWQASFTNLAVIHCKMGVKAIECIIYLIHGLPNYSFADGIVGECMFYAIRNCLGKEIYTHQVHLAWVKVYSKMLRSIIPIAVKYEMDAGGSPSTSSQSSNKSSTAFMSAVSLHTRRQIGFASSMPIVEEIDGAAHGNLFERHAFVSYSASPMSGSHPATTLAEAMQHHHAVHQQSSVADKLHLMHPPAADHADTDSDHSNAGGGSGGHKPVEEGDKADELRQELRLQVPE